MKRETKLETRVIETEIKDIKSSMEHKNLDVWKKSMDLVESIYKLTQTFPESEKFGLVSQMRRSAVSIPSNIAEGSARKGDKELIQFLYIALGSIAELETQYMIALRLNFVEHDMGIEELMLNVKKMLLGFKNYLGSKA